MTNEFWEIFAELLAEVSTAHLSEQDLAIATIVQAFRDHTTAPCAAPDVSGLSPKFAKLQMDNWRFIEDAKVDAPVFLSDWRFETYCKMAGITPSLVRGLYDGLLADPDPAKIAAWPFRHSIRCGSSQVADLI